MRKLVCSPVLLVCAIVLGFNREASAQAPSKSPFTVRVVGGFLGQVEGFCEAPGGTYEWPRAVEDSQPCADEKLNPGMRWLGGVLGVAALLEREARTAADWLLVGANNHPTAQDAGFLRHLAALKPDAVALGPEDFDRLMRGTSDGAARRVVEWIRANPAIPLLASNLAIRETAPHLNIIDSKGFHLEIADDVTFDWTQMSMSIGYPGDRPRVSMKEFESCDVKDPAAGQDAPVTLLADASALDFSPGLRPDRCYVVTLTAGSRSGTLRFRTDLALTPRANAAGPARGIPAVSDANRGALLVTLVDPDARARTAESAWSWTAGGRHYEIVFRSPAASLTTLVARAAASASGKTPVVMLASSLSDRQTLEILEEFPEIRVVVLGPESTLLGRVARPTKADVRPAFSGDLGFAGIVDAQYGGATKFFVRPEWFGETMISATGALTPSDGGWAITETAVKRDVVVGAALEWLPGNLVEFRARLGSDPPVNLAASPRYADCSGASTEEERCKDFRKLWASPESIAAMIGDAVTHRLASDMAVVPTSAVDADVRDWLGRTIDEHAQDARLMSRYILERLLYASPRMVRATVAGGDLSSMLSKIATAHPDYCTTGLGAGCSAADDAHPARLAVNGRRVNPQLYYSIAMSDSLAEELALRHDDTTHLIDLVATTDEYLLTGQWYVAGRKTTDLQQRTFRRQNGRYAGYWALSALDGGFSHVSLHDPSAEAGDVRGNLPIDFAGAQNTQTVTVGVDSDFAPLDLVHWALRFPIALGYVQKDQSGSISFDRDDLTMGVRWDYKWAVLGEVRPFIGAFVDGPFRTHTLAVRAARTVTSDDNFTIAEKANSSTTYLIEPSRYRHLAVGAEVLGSRTFRVGRMGFVAKKIGARWTQGRESRSPYGITIGGEPQSLPQYLSAGAASLLGDYFAAHRDSFTSQTPFVIDTREQDQMRPQFDAQGALSFKFGSRSYTTDFIAQLRWYRYPGRAPSDFSLTSTQRIEVKFTIPLVGRLTVAPNNTRQRAEIAAGTNNIFRYQSIDFSVSMPVVVRWGTGGSVR